MQEVFKSDLFFAALCKGKHGVDWVQGVDEQIGDLVRDRLSQQLVQFLDLMKIMTIIIYILYIYYYILYIYYYI